MDDQLETIRDNAERAGDLAQRFCITSGDEARAAIQSLFDYCDNNLSMMEAADCPTDVAQKLYDAAKALVVAFGVDP